MTPVEFWYANLGCRISETIQAGKDPTASALSRNYKHSAKDSSLRLGSGKAASLIMDGSAVLMADITLDHPVPDALTIHPGTWRTVPNWMADIIINPPDPPFMFVTYGKNPAIEDKMRLNVTSDVIEISGAQNLRCRPAVVKNALEAIGDIPAAVWRKAAYLADQRDRNQLSAARIDDQLDAFADKHPSIFDLLDILPPIGSGDYEATAIIHATRIKNAAATRSSDEASTASP